MKSGQVIVTFLVFLCWVESMAFVEPQLIPAPRRFPFDVSRGDSTLDVEIRVREYRSYYFALQFDYSGQNDLHRVLKLVGGGSRYPDGRYGKPGVVIPIHLRIDRVEAGLQAEPAYEDTVDTQGSYAHGFGEKKSHGHYLRKIWSVALKPGVYRVHVNTLKESPEFVGTSSHMKIEWHPNTRPFHE